MDIAENLKIEVAKTLKMIMLDKDLKQYEVGQNIGIKDRQPFNRLLQKSGDLRVNEVSQIADGMNCDVKISFVDRRTGKEWICNKI
jgi:hypothetical protein